MEPHESPYEPATTTTTPPQPPSRLSSSLPQDINTATRPLHTSLNHLITARLPLALPPHASDSKAYATGLRAFAHVYFAFEARWQALIAAESVREGSWIAVETYGEVLGRRRREGEEEGGDREEEDVGRGEVDGERGIEGEEGGGKEMDEEDEDEGREQGKGEAEVEAEAEAERECQRVRVNQVLADLLPPGLMRSRRLEADLAHLGIDSTEDLPTRVREFVARIDEEVEMKPWVLVAYAWVMYMAIFSGGRWVRQQLMDAGPGFWCHADGEAEDEQEWKGLAFLNFEGDEDGEDIKSEFKRRLASAEEVFDEEQRGDIVEEAKAIFTRCIGLVGELDDMLCSAGSIEKTGTLGHARSAKQLRRPVEAGPSGRILRQQSLEPRSPFSRPFLTGLAVVVGCVSWYAYYFASV